MLFDANEQQDLDAFSNRHFALPDIILALMCVRWPLTATWVRPWPRCSTGCPAETPREAGNTSRHRL